MKTLYFVCLFAFTAVVALTCMPAYAQEIPHIPFKTPHDWWDSYVHDAGNVLWVDSVFFYPQIARMGATHAHEYHPSSYGAHRGLLGRYNLGLWTFPGVSGDTFSVSEAMYRQWDFDEPFWNNGGDQWADEFFRLDTLIGTFTAGAMRCREGVDNAGYMFNNDTLFPQMGNYQRKYGLWLEIFKEDDDNSNTMVCSLRVRDPGFGGNAIDTTFLVRASDLIFDDWTYIGGFINKPFKRGADTRVSLYWNGQVTVRFKNIRFLDEFTYRLDYDPNKAAYWAACSTKVKQIQQDFQNDSRRLSGFIIDEPAYTTYGAFGQFRGRIVAWLNNPSIETTAISGGLRPAMMDRYLDSTGVPQLLWDNYTILWNASKASSGANSLQTAWENLIDYDNPASHQNHTGLKAAAEKAQEHGIPFWYCMQVHGSYYSSGGNNFWFREPTPAEIKCQGFLGLSFGAHGFMYYHYYSFYSGANYTALPDCTWFNRAAWRGSVDRGLTDLWQSPTDSVIGSQNELNSALSDSGVFVPNEKWYAVKDFIQYTKDVESFYLDCNYNKSVCATEENPVGRITIDSTYVPGGNRDLANDTYLQVGLLYGPTVIAIIAEPQTFMLVNRRCEDNETRAVRFRVSFNLGAYQHVVRDVATGVVLASGFGNSLSVVDTLAPGEGRLYFATTNLTVHNNVNADTVWAEAVIIDRPITVSSNATVEIRPLTTIFLTDSGKVTFDGRLSAKGKPDSMITIKPFNSTATGYFQLSGSSTDTLEYCRFEHLNTGLKISKPGTATTKISHCNFAGNQNEGIYVSGGDIYVTACEFEGNGTDGAYFYNCKVVMDSCNVSENERNGIYMYSVNSSSIIEHSSFTTNGNYDDSGPDGNIRFHNCSPTIGHSEFLSSAEYGIYGANGSYPVMYLGTINAANTISGNASHETYWDASWPMLDEGHNNFNTEDDTIIYITSNTLLTTLFAENNFWGSSLGPDNPGIDGSDSYEGPGTMDADPWVSTEQFSVPGEGFDAGQIGRKGGAGQISDAEEDARGLLKSAIDDEVEHPDRSIEAYRRIITRMGNTAAAPIACERLLWMIRNQYRDNERIEQLGNINRFFRSLYDTSRSEALRWKARRAALWALVAQHSYEAAIAGFEEIIEENRCLADSVFAVIDAGTLQLEAREWAARDSGNHIQSIFGSKQELAPATFAEHRKHTDELLYLLFGTGNLRRSTIPTEFFLNQNYPNPFNAITSITYGLPIEALVKLKIFDLMGREVASLINHSQKAGYYRVIWDGRTSAGIPVTSGMYFVRLETPQFTKVNKMTVLK